MLELIVARDTHVLVTNLLFKEHVEFVYMPMLL